MCCSFCQNINSLMEGKQQTELERRRDRQTEYHHFMDTTILLYSWCKNLQTKTALLYIKFRYEVRLQRLNRSSLLGDVFDKILATRRHVEHFHVTWITFMTAQQSWCCVRTCKTFCTAFHHRRMIHAWFPLRSAICCMCHGFFLSYQVFNRCAIFLRCGLRVV